MLSLPRHRAWGLWGLAALFLGGCGGAPFQWDDPRVGEFRGAILACRASPAPATMTIDRNGLARIESSLDGSVESGSPPAVLSDGGRELRFEFVRNSRGDLTGYSVDGRLSDDGQTVSGSLSYWTQPYGQRSKKPGPAGCQLSLRRIYRDPGFVATTPGDFSCATRQVFGLGASVRFGPPHRESMSEIPRPSCFDGELQALQLMPDISGRYRVEASTEGGHWADVDDTRPVAVFSACDGHELRCVTGGRRSDGTAPFVELELEAFQDVLLVSNGPLGVVSTFRSVR